MQKITPFLWFDMNAEEAINFYVSVFKNNPVDSVGDSEILGIKRYPEGEQTGPLAGMGGKVLTGVFTLNGQKFMALDGGPTFKPNEAVSFLVECKNQEEIDYFWNAFTADGGQESQCGWLKDKYGYSWQIAPDMGKFMIGVDQEKSRRAMEAMFQMKKIIIEDLQKAFDEE
jgi:predicted 3-demethylubiquinone-9 3-methyltransferase (glyoxalase superfamily)